MSIANSDCSTAIAQPKSCPHLYIPFTRLPSVRSRLNFLHQSPAQRRPQGLLENYAQTQPISRFAHETVQGPERSKNERQKRKKWSHRHRPLSLFYPPHSFSQCNLPQHEVPSECSSPLADSHAFFFSSCFGPHAVLDTGGVRAARRRAGWEDVHPAALRRLSGA